MDFNSNLYIVYLGGIFDEPTCNSRAVSLAANSWQKWLINALMQSGINIKVICHLPEPIWPKGTLFLTKDMAKMAFGFDGQIVQYWNIPFYRNRSLSRSYLKAFDSLVREKGKPDCIISYNIFGHSLAVGKYAQEKLGIPWISIIADRTATKLTCKNYNEILRLPKGRVFLSYGTYKNCPHKPKLHLDGGIDTEIVYASVKVHQKPIILYAGAVANYAGMSFLLKSFSKVKNREAELWICGKGFNSGLKHAIKQDERIKHLGLVSEKQLKELFKAASIFVNPLPSSFLDNSFNFPSKVLRYLSYLKPVISTQTDGLSDEYKEVLIMPEQETPECFANVMEAVLEWDDVQYRELAEKIKSFVTANKKWSIQAERLIRWLNQEVLIKERESL